MNKKLQKLLEESKKKYEVINHRTAYTAYDVAATLHLKLNQIAKSLLVKTNKPLMHGTKPYALVIVPADKNVDLKKLAKTMTTKETRITKVEIPKEGVMKTQFKVKPGSMAAFGSIYKLTVFVDKTVKGQMIFAAGNFEESIKMKAEDFVKIENAKIGIFSIAKKINKKKKK
jgi:prolyl-tRNA editing enzyme YbaK/EbsC (Cys-tRNA(Pro) deacylase)